MNSKANIMRRSAFFIAFFTTIVRYYDYALFGLSASILAKEFMPAESHEEQLLNFFLIFSIAVIFRPLGSIIFGTIGDKYGRGICVKISSFVGTISTGAFCFLPSYSSIGIVASISLLLCRILFVMSLSGEADAIKIYIREKSAKTNRNFLNGIVSSCSQIGALLAAFSFYYANKYQAIASEQAIALWRINFLLGSFCGCIIIYFRHLFQESEEFLTSQNKNTQVELLDLIKSNKVPFTLAIIINGICGGIYHLLIIFWSSFNFKVIGVINQQQLSVVNMYLIATYGLCSVISGYFADKINPERQIMKSLLFSFLIIAVMILSYADYNSILTFPLFLTGLMPFYVVPLQIIVQSMFHTENRMRLYSLSHSLGAMIFSSTTPLICSLLWKFTNKIQILFGFLELLIIILTISFLYLNKMDLIVNKY